MILYTPLPLEQVLDGIDYVEEFQEINYKGRTLQVECLNDGMYKIARIISTDPEDYLDSKLQPGNIIKMNF